VCALVSSNDNKTPVNRMNGTSNRAAGTSTKHCSPIIKRFFGVLACRRFWFDWPSPSWTNNLKCTSPGTKKFRVNSATFLPAQATRAVEHPRPLQRRRRDGNGTKTIHPAVKTHRQRSANRLRGDAPSVGQVPILREGILTAESLSKRRPATDSPADQCSVLRETRNHTGGVQNVAHW